jgi:enoyl-CoA hydratase/carnithine racemase
VSAAAGAVRLEVQGDVARITFDNVASRNAMTPGMYAELDGALGQLEREDSRVRVVVLRGAGNTFVSGTDISWFTSFESGEDGVRYEAALESTVARLEALPIPTIALVEGSAAGAGLILAAVCDLRVCTPEARFGMPIARTVGNCLSIANCVRLVSAMGASRVKHMILTAFMMPASDAHGCGFVSAVVDTAGIEQHVAELCARLAGNSAVTMAVTKEALRRLAHAVLPDDEDLLMRAYGSAEFRERVAAWIARRG